MSDRFVGIVDDEIDITETFQAAMCGSIEGISVFSFNDPILALEHFTANMKNYVLIISDLRMPGLNGLELLKKIKGANSNVRTILMSAYNFELDKLYQTYLKKGFIDSAIEKPVTITALCQRVRDEFQVYQLKSHLKKKYLLIMCIHEVPNNICNFKNITFNILSLTVIIPHLFSFF